MAANNRIQRFLLLTWSLLATLSCRDVHQPSRPSDLSNLSKFLGTVKPAGIPCVHYCFYYQAQPRPVCLYVLKVNIAAGCVRPIAIMSDGSAQKSGFVVRKDPLTLAGKKENIYAFINANPWIPWQPNHQPIEVQILGLAACDNKVFSEHQGVSVWLNKKGLMEIGLPHSYEDVVEGIGGFECIVDNGIILPDPADKQTHPRTAVGINQQGDTLWLVVADGRQKGYSEGLTRYELAIFMRKLGCWDAANLDGGGSSVMAIADQNGTLRIMNNPPHGRTHLRLLPIIFALQKVIPDK